MNAINLSICVQGTEPGDIGKVFAEFAPHLKMYTNYLNNNSAGE